MHPNTNNTTNTTGRLALSMLAGWTPSHRSLAAEVAELLDMKERDTAARVAFQRCKPVEH
ncbi:hypothetical protein SAE02_62860 [Skermanella aerolata]|uniref:Uncharacterized protein n=1 Tax=Skermanella aerolata TaxID=393310 RepID=A0A512E069_9PROT|nr:hypothetical protein [Skermanella aerolata]GEO42138.1 hypothetical protein SAE02_62860 [Skermanella aerolata]